MTFTLKQLKSLPAMQREGTWSYKGFDAMPPSGQEFTRNKIEGRNILRQQILSELSNLENKNESHKGENKM